MSPTGARQDLQTIQQSVAAGSVVVASTGTGPFEQILLDGRHALHADEPVPGGGSDAGPGVTGSEADGVRRVIRQSEDSLRHAKEEEALRHDALRRANEEALRRAGEAVHSLIIPDVWPPRPQAGL